MPIQQVTYPRGLRVKRGVYFGALSSTKVHSEHGFLEIESTCNAREDRELGGPRGSSKPSKIETLTMGMSMSRCGPLSSRSSRGLQSPK